MIRKIEVTIDVIVHATEDIGKIIQSLDIFELKESDFTVYETKGHYENPIITLNAKIGKKQALSFIRKLTHLLSAEQIDKLIGEIEERTINSRFHMRLDKQELMRGNLVIGNRETIRIKIYTPVYNKKDIVKSFTEIFKIAN